MTIANDSVIQINGAAVDGKQPVEISTDLQEFKSQLEEAVAGTITPVGATTADLLPYVDSVTGAIEFTPVNLMLDSALVIATDSGSGTSIVTSGTPTALPIFDTDFYSSTPAVTDTAGDLGITLGVPSRFRVGITASVAAGVGNDFLFQVYVGGVACGRVVTVSGDGTGKLMNFAMQCISQVVTPTDTVELRVSNSGDTITSISADMFVQFAGL
jgi:hypothetical protein